MAARGALRAWSAYDTTASDRNNLNAHYAANWALYTGRAFNEVWRREGVFSDERVYRNTRLLWKHVESVVDFWGSVVYQGALATDGKRLPDGSRGAIPWDAQVTGEGSAAKNDAILRAFAELDKRWNWQQGMSLRPLYVSALGDGLTELIDDPKRHIVWPQFIWPGYVVDVELDHARNVKSYVLEYEIERDEDGVFKTFTFRKEVDKNEFRYYRDGDPWNAYGDGEVVENIYGFVPAVWDVHKIGGGVRGLSAIAGTRQALSELNSLMSQGFDYQRKAFAAPVLLKGGGLTNSLADAVRQVIGPSRTVDPAELAESMPWREVPVTAGIEQLSFDIGKTLEILDWIKKGILEENPEASFYHDLREMSTLTAPGAERALGDATNRVMRVRAGMDPNTVKLHQMATTMCAMRLDASEWEDPTPRDEVFRAFNQDSYEAGDLDVIILSRPVVPQTEEERIHLLQLKESLNDVESLTELGMDPDVAQRYLDRRDASSLRRAELFGQQNL